MQQEVEKEAEENEYNKNKILITFYSAFLFLTNVTRHFQFTLNETKKKVSF